MHVGGSWVGIDIMLYHFLLPRVRTLQFDTAVCSCRTLLHRRLGAVYRRKLFMFYVRLCLNMRSYSQSSILMIQYSWLNNVRKKKESKKIK